MDSTPEFYTGSINDATEMVLVNALYFKANWKLPFDPKFTKNSTFSLGSKNVINVPMMSISGENFRTAFFADLNARVVEIPYEVDQDFILNFAILIL